MRSIRKTIGCSLTRLASAVSRVQSSSGNTSPSCSNSTAGIPSREARESSTLWRNAETSANCSVAEQRLCLYHAVRNRTPLATFQRQDDSPRLGRSIMERMSRHISIDRDAVSAFYRRHHITRLALFGSVLRDDFRPDSDVDVLVEFQADHVPGFNFVSIERELSGLLHGRRVDMVTPKFLNPCIRDQVLSSAEPLYVAA